MRLPSGDQVGNASQAGIGGKSSSRAARESSSQMSLILCLRIGALNGHPLAVAAKW